MRTIPPRGAASCTNHQVCIASYHWVQFLQQILHLLHYLHRPAIYPLDMLCVRVYIGVLIFTTFVVQDLMLSNTIRTN